MERKELESETIGSWDGDIAEYTDFHDYYLKGEADKVMDAMENRIKELENDKLDVNTYIINLRYERIRYKAIYMRTQANYSSYESWLYGGHLNSMSYDTWLSRVLAIVDAYESRAKQLKEQM